MKPIKFSEKKHEIQKALEEILKTSSIHEEAGFTMIEGFMTLSLQNELSNNIILGGTSIPIVGIVGKKTGRIYTFALKAILPNIEL